MRWSPALRQFESLFARPIAHRGLHDIDAGIVENTRAAFASAIAGNYAIECDLQLSSDGEAMVFHDGTLDRLTHAVGPLRERSARELSEVTFKAGRNRMQTLGELLDQVDGEVPLVIEIKSRWDGSEELVRRAAEWLSGYNGIHALMSFDPDIVAAMRRFAPSSMRGIVTDRATHPEYRDLPLSRRLELRHFTHIDRTQPHFISYHWESMPYPPVTQFRDHGGPVICWTVRNAEAASAARRYADQITFEGFRA